MKRLNISAISVDVITLPTIVIDQANECCEHPAPAPHSPRSASVDRSSGGMRSVRLDGLFPTLTWPTTPATGDPIPELGRCLAFRVRVLDLGATEGDLCDQG